jgi:hypothetical protein
MGVSRKIATLIENLRGLDGTIVRQVVGDGSAASLAEILIAAARSAEAGYIIIGFDNAHTVTN